MTYALPPLNALRAFEAAARHLSFKLAAHELHVTPAAVGQQVKALEARLGVQLFERLHKQLILTEAGQAYLPGVSEGFRHIAEATSQLKPAGAVLLQAGVHGSIDLRRLELAAFRSAHAEIGLRVLQPAGLHELVEGKVDVLIARGETARKSPPASGRRRRELTGPTLRAEAQGCVQLTASLPVQRKIVVNFQGASS
ncbi:MULTISPECIES: LysR family transcriptional regulator [unclassified Bradyrhizobium]|jgi:DNA-binding transcriptional LysR family regulator|uniref:LysR family transcriptional regulator n=1 Tax=unclassified Bradyrhizobium TaxID=2631580 RepID=UPI001FDEE875|nr:MULTISPECIES: LysR family transcriptional regulator [unclassified Bradyrhizobium]